MDNIWKILEQFECLRDVDDGDNVRCIICQKLLVDTYKGACGCKFCKRCLEIHINGGERHCPGGQLQCEEYELLMDITVCRDPRTNGKVLKLMVKCPEKRCQHRVELGVIGDHLRICDQRIIDCPYHNFGCEHPKIEKEQLTTHLQYAILDHTKILVASINNLRNENTNLKQEMTAVHDEMKHKDEQISMLEKELRTFKVVHKYDGLSDTLKEGIKIEGISVKRSSHRSNHDNSVSTKDNSPKVPPLIITSIDKTKKEMEGRLKQEINKLRNEICYLDAVLKIRAPCAKYGEMIMRVDDFLTTKDTLESDELECIISQDFLSHANGYEMNLHLYPNGIGMSSRNVFTVQLWILTDDATNGLQWPFDQTVTISIVDQDTGFDFVSRQQKCIVNRGYYSGNLFHYSKLDLPKWLSKNNSILIRCLVGKFV